jgi:sporulation protein YlmC with PRC-barrel domain
MADIHALSPVADNALIASDRVEGTAVFDASGKRVGSVTRVMIEKFTGKVAYAVLSFSDLLRMADGHHTIPWEKLDYDTSLGGYRTGITEVQFRGAPDFSRNQETDWSDRGRDRELRDYYGA